jgi:hypothetical protein
MATSHADASLQQAVAGPDPSWQGLYRAGGLCAALFVVLTLSTFTLVAFVPQPPSGGSTGSLQEGAATLQYIADHKPAYLLNLVLFLAPSLLSLVVFLALYVALMGVSKSLAAIGALVGIAATISYLTPFALVFGLVPLSDAYVAATNAAQRATVVTTADGLIAQVNTVSAGGILYGIGILILSLAMFKGVFHKAVAYLGIVTGVVGIVCESLRPILGAWYGIYGILLIWFLAVGWQLYRLGARSRNGSSIERIASAESQEARSQAL